ncbi:AAA family ATPase [Salinibacterium sp. SWN139]|uniref:AAA family ATPase n=1 Tax=Salinibacterium sp. SWN139 TaxID=2792055 RepID=UPI0018CF7FF0|nr:AAA family ATPase [Salinibacterium sp. SWN139]MBH0054476.1 AAA family ATPase [Salinibacterium sp. SWN139]
MNDDDYMAALDAAIAAEGTNRELTPQELGEQRRADRIEKYGTADERAAERNAVAHNNRVMVARMEFETRDAWNETPEETKEIETVIAQAEAVVEAEAKALDMTVAEMEQTKRTENAIANRVHQLEIDQEARRRVAAKNYDGLGGLLSWEDLEDVGAMNWLVPGWIPMGETCFLVAKRNLGKSMFSFALGFSVALGLPFLDQPTTKGKVLFVLGEGSRGFIKRLKSWALANSVNPNDLRDQVAVYKGGKINNDESLADMQKEIDRLDPSLVVFDTYSSLSGVVNEIDAAENAEVLNRIKRTAPDAAVLVLAHPNAESENTTAPRLRGSSVLSSNVDTVITMFKDKNRVVPGMPFDEWLAISTAEAHAGKQKDESNKTLHGLAVLANSEGAYLDYVSATPMSVSDRWVSGNLTVGAMVTVKALVAASGASANTVRNHLKDSTLVTAWPSTSGGPTEYRRDR